ncbi:MAG: CPBP family intramembrane glutamic endopeptidase [Balneolaceae bacterium]
MPPEKDDFLNEEKGLNMSGRELLHMSAGSFIFYLLVSTILFYFFHEKSLFTVFEHGYTLIYQVLTGILAGVAAAGVIIFFSSVPPVKNVLDDFTIFRMIAKTDFTHFDRIHISFFAGAGEELLFRGAIQPLLGIWVTSFIFIAIHGYVSFRSAGHVLFTLLLFGLGMMLGYLFMIAGIVAAMVAHAVYDLVMLWWVVRYNGEVLDDQARNS